MVPIPSNIWKDVKAFVVNEGWAEPSIKIRPASTVALIGYPYGFFDKKNWLPIWKTGTIASEYDFDFDGKPLFLVDVSAFPGMSGSPVFAVANGTYEATGGVAKVGWSKDLLGIYASMETLEEGKYLEELEYGSKSGIVLDKSLELGHVWRASLIIDIAKSFDPVKYGNEILQDL